MPGDLRTPFPTKHAGEANLARSLVAVLESDVHLWFGIDYLMGPKDIDLIVWDEQAGVFVIEIKAVSLEMFETYNLSRCRIQGRKSPKTPHGQALEASEDLRNYLYGRNVEFPFIVATAAFPLITRSSLVARWGSHEIAGDFAQSILFKEDFESGRVALRDRLSHIYFNPPRRSGSTRAFKHKPDQLEGFHQAIAPEDATPAAPTPSDLDRLRAIERTVARNWIEKVPPFGDARIGFVGLPGTGKTFRLVQIGVSHADRGADVLYLCFNKVLAADIRRLLEFRESGADPIDVYDVFQLLQLRLGERGLAGGEPGADRDFETYGNDAVELLADVQDEIASYDTVLLDEAQDLDDWQVRLAELHLKVGGTFLIGIGKGQELYRSDLSNRLKAVLNGIDGEQLRRNFRNTKETFQVAFVAYESNLELDGIKSASRRFRTELTKEAHQGLLFERKKGRFPILAHVDTDELSNEDRSTRFYAEQEREILAIAYSELIAAQLRDLDESDRPTDLLVLVPDAKSQEGAAARAALRRIGQEFFDLTDDRARRAAVPSTAVRLCTFHSCRGVEGNRVLILGFARLPKLCDQLQIAAAHLAYIVLSRAVFETVIAVRSEEWNQDIVAFMQEAIARLQKSSG